jgi:hypothetical protein
VCVRVPWISQSVGATRQNLGATRQNLGATRQNLGATRQNLGATRQDGVPRYAIVCREVIGNKSVCLQKMRFAATP